MRAREFITEQHGTLAQDVSRALPGTYTISDLPNNDFYKQYRFGVAMADAIIALTSNIAMKKKQRIDFKESWFDPLKEDCTIPLVCNKDLDLVLLLGAVL